MAAVSESVVIRRKPSEVYDYILDVTNQPSWETAVVSVTPDDGQTVVHEGSRLTYVMRGPGGMKYPATSVISDLVPGRRGTYTLTSRFGVFRGAYILEDHPDGTTFVSEVDVAPECTGLRATVARALTPMARRDVRTGLQALRGNLEQSVCMTARLTTAELAPSSLPASQS